MSIVSIDEKYRQRVSVPKSGKRRARSPFHPERRLLKRVFRKRLEIFRHRASARNTSVAHESNATATVSAEVSPRPSVASFVIYVITVETYVLVGKVHLVLITYTSFASNRSCRVSLTDASGTTFARQYLHVAGRAQEHWTRLLRTREHRAGRGSLAVTGQARVVVQADVPPSGHFVSDNPATCGTQKTGYGDRTD